MLKDISAGGAAIGADLDVKHGGPVALEIEEMSPLDGLVARTFDDGFAVEFDLDEEEEDRLISELMVIRTAIRREDE